MRRIQMVGMLLAMISLGCSGGQSSKQIEASILPGCKAVNMKTSAVLAEKAKNFFENEVGVALTAVKVESISDCAEKYVVPIDATSATTNANRLWFVEIDKADNSRMLLVRPE